ncbi:MAG TPA: MraY family glycosyltransferase [Acidimicrobiales bacterium]|nr:MraY family glycosyltransferase [Acidimicrobiales bacterium]
MSPEVSSALVAGIAAVATFGLTFLIRAVATGRGLVVQPDPQRVHTQATPTAGGLALILGFAFAVLVARPLGFTRYRLGHSLFALNGTEIVGVVIAVVVIGLLGLVDDVRGTSPPAKVAGQVLAAMVLYFFGVTMTQVKVPFVSSYIVLGATLLPLVTALWVVGIANAVNLIDGLDGLAAGVVAIGAGSLCIYGLRLIDLGALAQNNIGPLLAAACCGICVGFLPHNFYRAKIFMGDTGAMVLGLLMAAATMEIGGQANYVISGATYFFVAPLVVPIVILAVPLLDTALAVVRRAVRRTKVTERDLEHLHYRLMRLGHGHRRAVLVLWGWTLVLSGLVLYPVFYPRWNAAVPFAVAILAIALVTAFRPGLRRTGRGAPAPAVATDVDGAADHRPGLRRTPVGTDETVGGAPPGGAGLGGHDGAAEAYRRAHRRRFARHHPPMRG